MRHPCLTVRDFTACRTWQKGANQIFPVSGRFVPGKIFHLISAYEGVTLWLAPTMILRLLNSHEMAGADTRHLKTLVYGGAPMYVEDLKHALTSLGPKLVQIYGQGESPMTITSLSKACHASVDHPRYSERLASVGVPRAGVEVRVVDPNDCDLPPAEPGEVLVRGDVVMKGYWKNEEATARHCAAAGCIQETSGRLAKMASLPSRTD